MTQKKTQPKFYYFLSGKYADDIPTDPSDGRSCWGKHFVFNHNTVWWSRTTVRVTEAEQQLQ